MKQIECMALLVCSIFISTASNGQTPTDQLNLLALSTTQAVATTTEYSSGTSVAWENLLGEWKITVEYLGASGSVVRTAEGSWKIFKAMEGPVVREIAEIIMPSGESFQFIGFFIFDQSNSNCQRVVIDSINKKLEILEGISNKGKVILNTTENGEEFRQTFYNISKDGFEWKQEKLDKATGTWSTGVHTFAWRN